MRQLERRGNRKVHMFTFNASALDTRVEVDGDSFAATSVSTSDGLAD